ncbi:MAG TPA: RNA methyltransferase, partial [Paludibacter sp.]
LSLALDDVQDPGNLGTILRIADWFGISDVFCSEYTADAYSPKTVQATMGALARVKIHSVNLAEFLQNCSDILPIYGTLMNGENIYNKTLTQQGIIVMGNEGNGISATIEKFVSERLLIPNFPAGQVTSESLNVGVATALVCGEFRRRVSR